MRILVIHNHYRSGSPSGESVVVDQEVSGLRSLGHQVELFAKCSDEIDAWNPIRRAGVPLDSVLGVTSRAPLRSIVQRFEPDVAHVHNLFPLISPIALDVCARNGVPVVATLHNYRLLCARGDFFRDGSLCLECADGSAAPALKHGCFHNSRIETAAVVAGTVMTRLRWQSLVSAYLFISAAQKQQFSALGLDNERCFVKWNAGPGDLRPIGSSAHQIAHIGRLEPAKGTDVLMRAWERFMSSSPGSSLRLAIVGGGPMSEEVSAWARHWPNVDFFGLLSHGEAMRVLGQSRCVLIPSQWLETFGLVAVEAMALGVAPIASDHGAFPELLLGNEEYGRLVKPGDPEAWAAAISEVDAYPMSYMELGRKARERFLAEFEPRASLERLESVYRYALDNPRVARRRFFGHGPQE